MAEKRENKSVTEPDRPIPEPKRQKSDPDSTHTPEPKEIPTQIVLPQQREPNRNPERNQGGVDQPLWTPHSNGMEGMREWTRHAKEQLLLMRIRTWSDHRIATMFGRMVPPDRYLPPPEWIAQDLPQDRFTFNMEDLRDRSDTDSTSDTD